MNIPEVISNYNVYGGDNSKLIGVSGEVSLVEIGAVTATVSGAGMLGEMNIPAKHTDTIGIPVFAALQRICEVGTELKKQEEDSRAEDHDKQGD